MPTPSKKLRPFMAYIDESQHKKMTRLSKKINLPMSQLVREAINMRLASGDPYTTGFNDGLNKAITIVSDNKAAQMRFPSGRSFAELVNEDIANARMEEQGESTEG
jgi:hypothetical protein